MRGESGTTQSNDAGLEDLIDDGFRLKVAVGDQVIAPVDAFQPFVTFHGNVDGWLIITGDVCSWFHLDDFAGNRRMDVG
ncbi:MAG: hypothetical protein BWY72_01753 [Bacteroidetes bacterium ADurb.Bin416]|nr:MAG: hypothetical protein BWY72_01753 [Bacteroidetes bacterium ADurb.Bin416]